MRETPRPARGRPPAHTSPAYRAVVRFALAVWPMLQGEGRQRNAHMQRLAAPRRMAEWSAAHRERARPLAWFHAASVGEGLQARAVLEAFRAIRPEFQVVFTHFSPSAESLAAGMPADLVSYLPYDRAGDVVAALDALSPDLLVSRSLISGRNSPPALLLGDRRRGGCCHGARG